MTSTPYAAGNPSVSDQVLVALRKIIQSIDLHSRNLVKRFGLTGPQLIVLREIAARGETTAGEIARAVSLGQATITGILERLEKRELITRCRSDADRRRLQLRSTPAGERLLADTPPLMQEAFVAAFGGIEDWEKSMILASLQRLVALMDARQIQAAPILATGPLDPGSEDCGMPTATQACVAGEDLDPRH
jgi:DNA-binding MarR family transcriptional regulator